MASLKFIFLAFVLLCFSNFDRKGEKEAKKYCSSCHLFPEPSLLDKKTWINSVLPNMGQRLGIIPQGNFGFNFEDSLTIVEMGIFPEKPLISKKEWDQIVTFYSQNAPEKLTLPSIPIFESSKMFKEKLVKIPGIKVPKTSLLKYDSKTLYVANSQNIIYTFNKNLDIDQIFLVDSVPVQLHFSKNQDIKVLTMGVFSPNDLKRGSLKSLKSSLFSIKNLKRPVHFTEANLTGASQKDIVICEFGNFEGQLSWFDARNAFEKNILLNRPGARKTIIRDLNKDRKDDIIVLMTQALEGVFSFINNGEGNFEMSSLLEFNPAFGLINFEMVDFNNDGFEDILLVNGDNWDLSPIKKPYHGIRIYLNDGKNHFKEHYFFPLFGANNAKVADFDLDGDLDIIGTSFYDNTEQSILIFINKGNLEFEISSLEASNTGKWLTLEVVDFDKDGDMDFFVGSYFQGINEIKEQIQQGNTEFPQFIYYENLIL